MIFHTFLFVVAVLLSYVRNGFGIIPVMLDYCAVFKIRFAIVFLSEPAEGCLGCRTESAFLALGREAVLRFGYAMPPGFAPLSPAFPEMPEYEGRD